MYDILHKMYADNTFFKVCSIPSASEVPIFGDKVEERQSLDGDCEELNVETAPREPDVTDVEEETIDLSSAG